MAKIKNSKNGKKGSGAGGKIVGAIVGGALGVVAGMLLAPKSGAKLRNDVKNRIADFYRYAAPKLKKLKTVSEKEFEAFVDNAVSTYGQAKDLTKEEMAELKENAKGFWKQIRKNL